MSSNNTPYDVIVVGAGPGGLAAGMYAARAKLKSIVLERASRGQINNTGTIEDYPGFSSIDARELAQKMEDHAKEFGAEIKTVESTGVQEKGELFEVTTAGRAASGENRDLGDWRQPELFGMQRGNGVSEKGRQLLRHLRRPAPALPE